LDRTPDGDQNPRRLLENPEINMTMKRQHQSASQTGQPSMALSSAPWSWALGAGEVRRIEASACARWFVVGEGQVWLTRSGRNVAVAQVPPTEDLPQPAAQADYWLGSGEQLFLPAGSEWVIEASAPRGERAVGGASVAMWLPAEPSAMAGADAGALSSGAWPWVSLWLQRLRGLVVSAPKLAHRLP
jgi:hypothetical protein